MEKSIANKISFEWVLSESRTLRYVTFFAWYIMQGIPAGFALTALANYLAAEQVGAGEIGSFVALVGLPWGLKFIWGPIVDRYTYWSMGRRRPWIIACQLLAVIALAGTLLVESPTAEFRTLSILFFLHAVFASVQDVVVDALAIEVVPVTERGKTTAFMRSGMVLGTAIGAAGLGYILRVYGFGWAAFGEASLLGCLTVLSFFVKERRTDALLPVTRKPLGYPTLKSENADIKLILRKLMRGIFQKSSILFTVAISIVYIAESLYRRVLDVHLIQQVGWSDLQLTGLKGIPGTVLTLSAVLLGGWLVDRLGVRRVLMANVLILLALYLGYSALEPYWGNFGLTSSFLLAKGTVDALVNVAAIPLFMYLARPGVEGSQFVFYMALSNQMDVVGASLAGLATSQISMAGLGYTCSSAIIIAALLIRWGSIPQAKV